METKTKIYEYHPGTSKQIKIIEGVLLPHMPKGTAIEVDGYNYMVKTWGIIIQGDTSIVVIYVE